MKKNKANSITDWARVDATADEAIDYTDNPKLGDEFWADAEWFEGNKKPISLRLDKDVYFFFKEKGKGYQTAINKVLRHYMEAQQRKSK